MEEKNKSGLVNLIVKSVPLMIFCGGAVGGGIVARYYGVDTGTTVFGLSTLGALISSSYFHSDSYKTEDDYDF